MCLKTSHLDFLLLCESFFFVRSWMSLQILRKRKGKEKTRRQPSFFLVDFRTLLFDALDQHFKNLVLHTSMKMKKKKRKREIFMRRLCCASECDFSVMNLNAFSRFRYIPFRAKTLCKCPSSPSYKLNSRMFSLGCQPVYEENNSEFNPGWACG